MFHFQVSSVLGYVLGPLIAWLLEVFVKELRIENLLLDSETAPGWLMAALYFKLMLLLYLVFESPPTGPSESAEATEKHPADSVRSKLKSLEWRGLVACMWATSAGTISNGMVEVFAVNIAETVWAWSVQAAALFLAGLMAFNIPVCLVAGKFTASFEDRQGLLLACCLGVLISPLLFCFSLHSSPARIVVPSLGLMLTPAVNMLLRGFSMSSITKLVPPELKHVASVATMCPCCACRGLGALLGSVLEPASLGGVQLGLLLLTGGLTSFAYARMKPHEKAF